MLLFWLKEVSISLQKIVMSHINAAWEGSSLLMLSILTRRGHKIDRGVEGVGGGHGFHRGNKNTESARETSRTNQYSFPSMQKSLRLKSFRSSHECTNEYYTLRASGGIWGKLFCPSLWNMKAVSKSWFLSSLMVPSKASNIWPFQV